MQQRPLDQAATHELPERGEQRHQRPEQHRSVEQLVTVLVEDGLGVTIKEPSGIIMNLQSSAPRLVPEKHM